MKRPVKAVLHGSFRYALEFERTRTLFTDAGIEVVAPGRVEVTCYDGRFPRLASDDPSTPKELVELRYLQKVLSMGPRGFSYFIDPEGCLGSTASAEFGVALSHGIPAFLMKMLEDPPLFAPNSSIWRPEDLAEYIHSCGELPPVTIDPREQEAYALSECTVSGPPVSVGAVITNERSNPEDPEVLLVKSPSWDGRYTIVGERLKRGERMASALEAAVSKKTGLPPLIGKLLASLDEEPGTCSHGRIFVDYTATLQGKKLHPASDGCVYEWIPLSSALGEAKLEPNARKALELYSTAH